jgi:hypothetical protein
VGAGTNLDTRARRILLGLRLHDTGEPHSGAGISLFIRNSAGCPGRMASLYLPEDRRRHGVLRGRCHIAPQCDDGHSIRRSSPMNWAAIFGGTGDLRSGNLCRFVRENKGLLASHVKPPAKTHCRAGISTRWPLNEPRDGLGRQTASFLIVDEPTQGIECPRPKPRSIKLLRDIATSGRPQSCSFRAICLEVGWHE